MQSYAIHEKGLQVHKIVAVKCAASTSFGTVNFYVHVTFLFIHKNNLIIPHMHMQSRNNCL